MPRRTQERMHRLYHMFLPKSTFLAACERSRRFPDDAACSESEVDGVRILPKLLVLLDREPVVTCCNVADAKLNPARASLARGAASGPCPKTPCPGLDPGLQTLRTRSWPRIKESTMRFYLIASCSSRTKEASFASVDPRHDCPRSASAAQWIGTSNAMLQGMARRRQANHQKRLPNRAANGPPCGSANPRRLGRSSPNARARVLKSS